MSELQRDARTSGEALRVLKDNIREMPELQEKPFDVAPILYSYNVPRYYALLLRARKYAQTNKQMLRWFVAQDVPLHCDD